MESANTGGVRLVRCPKCYNILPEPPNVSVYKCGGCNTTLRAKIRVSSGENVVTKQVRQNSDNRSVVTTVITEVPPQKKELSLTVDTVDSSGTPDAPSTETKNERSGVRSDENGDFRSDDNRVAKVADTENNGVRSDENADVTSDENRVAKVANTENNGVRSDENGDVTSVENRVANVANTENNGMRSDENGDVMSDENRVANAANTENNGMRSDENDDVTSDENRVANVANTENKNDSDFDGQDTNTEMEAPIELTRSNTGGSDTGGSDTHVDSDEEDNNNTMEPASLENSEVCRMKEEDGMECNQNNSEHSNSMPVSDGRNSADSSPDSEQNSVYETEPAASKRSKLARMQSRSCDLREVPGPSAHSPDFNSLHSSFRSKSFRASEPLESKIMKTVDDLRGDLSEIFSKPSDGKPKAFPPRPLKQDGHMRHAAAITSRSSPPLTDYRPSGKHSGHGSRLSWSGQVAPQESPSPRYQRRRGTSSYGSSSRQMEVLSCTQECCHGCRLPYCSSWKQEPAPQSKPPSGKEMKRRRRPAPRNLCRPVLRGAPFVLCSNCLRLVQLPAEFAVPSRRTRRLQCGSCSEILCYSYRDPSRRKPQSPFGEDDQYSMDDEHHNNGGAHRAGPYSYSSEEYGLTAGASYSMEDEQQLLHVSRNSSFSTMGGASAKGSKLHRLMGYTSASELLRHQRSPDLYESFSRRGPAARTHDLKGKGVYVTDTDDSGSEVHGAIAVKKSKARSGGLPFQGLLKLR